MKAKQLKELLKTAKDDQDVYFVVGERKGDKEVFVITGVWSEGKVFLLAGRKRKTQTLIIN